MLINSIVVKKTSHTCPLGKRYNWFPICFTFTLINSKSNRFSVMNRSEGTRLDSHRFRKGETFLRRLITSIWLAFIRDFIFYFV